MSADWNPDQADPERPLDSAELLQRRAAQFGFDWPEPGPVWDKLTEEIGELQAAVAAAATDQIRHELGDLLFTVVNLARHLNEDPGRALHAANQRFAGRVAAMQALTSAPLETLTADALEDLWQAVKRSG